MAALRAPEFFLARTSHLRAFLSPALSLSCCLAVARLSAEEVSTPMSKPLFSHLMGTLRPWRVFVIPSAALDSGITTLLLDMDMRSLLMVLAKWVA